jgi:integrase
MKREHIVPLAPQAVSLLRELRRLPGSDSSPYLFPSPSKEGFMSNNTMLYALYRLGYHSRATVHGFRATASTALNEMGFRADVIERQLAHQENNVRAAYNRAEYLPERRAMMIHWANHLDKIIDGQRIGGSMSGAVTRSDPTSRHSGALNKK